MQKQYFDEPKMIIKRMALREQNIIEWNRGAQCTVYETASIGWINFLVLVIFSSIILYRIAGNKILSAENIALHIVFSLGT